MKEEIICFLNFDIRHQLPFDKILVQHHPNWEEIHDSCHFGHEYHKFYQHIHHWFVKTPLKKTPNQIYESIRSAIHFTFQLRLGLHISMPMACDRLFYPANYMLNQLHWHGSSRAMHTTLEKQENEHKSRGNEFSYSVLITIMKFCSFAAANWWI